MFRSPPARFPCRNFQAEKERTQGRKMSMPDLLRLLMENASAKGRFTARNRGGRKALDGHCRPARGPFNGWEQLRGSSDETGPLAVASALRSFFYGGADRKTLRVRIDAVLCSVPHSVSQASAMDGAARTARRQQASAGNLIHSTRKPLQCMFHARIRTASARGVSGGTGL